MSLHLMAFSRQQHSTTVIFSSILTYLRAWLTALHTVTVLLLLLLPLLLLLLLVIVIIIFNNCPTDATYSVCSISVGSCTCFGRWHTSSGASTVIKFDSIHDARINEYNNNNIIIIKKEAEKILKHKDLIIHIQPTWDVTEKVITLIIRATGSNSKSFRQYLSI